MKHYSFDDDTIIGSVRSLKCFYGYYTYLKRNYVSLSKRLFTFDKRECSRYVDDLSDFLRFRQIVCKYGVDDFLSACRYVHNIYMRTTRIKKRLESMLSQFGSIYFVTLTLKDNLSLSNSLLDSVKCFCRTSSSAWFFNPDYGTQNGRLHFHCVCTVDLCSLDNLSNLWSFGYINYQLIRSSDDFQKISNYVVKLAKHSTKFGTLKSYFSRAKKV